MSGDTIFGDFDAILSEGMELIEAQIGGQKSFFAKIRMVAPPHRSERVRAGENILARFNWDRLADPAGSHNLDAAFEGQLLTSEANAFAEEAGGIHRAVREAVIEAARIAELECRAEGMRLRDAEHGALVEGLFGQLQRHASALDQTAPSPTMSPDARAAWETARDRARDLVAALDDVRRTLPRSQARGPGQDYGNKALVGALAAAFEAITGVAAGKTRGGPFARFTRAAFRFLERGPPSGSDLDGWLDGFVERGSWKKSAAPQGKSQRK